MEHKDRVSRRLDVLASVAFVVGVAQFEMNYVFLLIFRGIFRQGSWV